ncbi:hypothetical protein RhiirA4_481986 [Rhizophagus irregularis]|uniref:Uncharacterized protein n=1 Tax=Rhizophagus irregularis TaxID=588596 RepID=A0A2I1HKC7_9GLOM|nr:hypothetical protein RhiirA4_481986 [Rhizophagus irregularis]
MREKKYYILYRQKISSRKFKILEVSNSIDKAVIESSIRYLLHENPFFIMDKSFKYKFKNTMTVYFTAMKITAPFNPKSAFKQNPNKIIVEFQSEADLFNMCDKCYHFNERIPAVVYNILEEVTTGTLWNDQRPTTYLTELGAKSFKIIQTGKESGGKKAHSSNVKSKKKDDKSSSKAPNTGNKLKKPLDQKTKASDVSDNSNKKAKGGNSSNKEIVSKRRNPFLRPFRIRSLIKKHQLTDKTNQPIIHIHKIELDFNGKNAIVRACDESLLARNEYDLRIGTFNVNKSDNDLLNHLESDDGIIVDEAKIGNGAYRSIYTILQTLIWKESSPAIINAM